MILIKKAEGLQELLLKAKVKSQTIGFIPTMGALHEGHISLIETAKSNGNFTVCSIFVNPTQFNDSNDFKLYPVTIDTDIYKLESAGCNLLFLPSVKEVYPGELQLTHHYDLGNLENILEGKYRPGHFQGVCQVVHRLLSIIQPHQLYLGQKDYQQCMVLSRLLNQIELEEKVTIEICPTLREPDGLAMSSRNMRLNEMERQTATNIFKTLLLLKENIQPGTLEPLIAKSLEQLDGQGFKPDYVSIADARTLEILDNWDGKTPIISLIATWLNDVRLIDNMILH